MFTTYKDKVFLDGCSNQLSIRPANINDCQLLFDWANDSDVRKMALSKEAISWECHKKWFKDRLKTSKTQILIGIDSNNNPVGQIRFDYIDLSVAEVDIHTKPDLKGRGIGTKLILMGTSYFLSISNVTSIRAFVLKSNIASIKAFRKAGYTVSRRLIIRHEHVIELIINRNLNS